MEGKKYILHKVEQKETLEGLSRRYDVTVKDIRSSNIGIRQLKTGQIINIPAKSTFTNSNKSSEEVKPKVGEKIPVYYTVKPGETMYSISRNFNKTIDELKRYNVLETHDLKNGQRLIVGYKKSDEVVANTNFNESSNEATAAIAATAVASNNVEITQPIRTDIEEPTKTISEIKSETTGKILMQVTETGAASWIQDSQFGENKFYALHRTAPIGTIIKVTNRMNSVAVYVKVVGVLPDTGDNENIIIKVSQSVTSRLNALDPVFQAELTYGVYE
jgi:LysM repeat protein